MRSQSTALLALVTMCAFASNSVLCRLALLPGLLDPGSFTVVRLASGALLLIVLLRVRGSRGWKSPHWGGALALAGYAGPFSYAYVTIPVGVGALVLFAAVQITMVGWDVARGRRVTGHEWSGLTLALAGLAALTLPGAASADPLGAALMGLAGISWGIYSIIGKGSADPLANTGSNFLFAIPFVLPLLALPSSGVVSADGLLLGLASGALASGLGYVLWYTVLPRVSSTQAAILQMMVPVLAALAGAMFLDEIIGLRMILAGTAILSGIFLAVVLPAWRTAAPISVIQRSPSEGSET